MRTLDSTHDPNEALVDPRIDLHQLSEYWKDISFDMSDNTQNQPTSPVDLEDVALLAQFAAAMQGQDNREPSGAFLRNLLHSQPQYPPYIPPPQMLNTTWPVPAYDQRLPFQYSSPAFSAQSPTPEAGPSAPMSELENAVAIAEDKRRRNTTASARFRIKKKLRTLNLERSVSDLSGRAEELEREAADLRRENGWLKEIVLLKGLNLKPDMIPGGSSRRRNVAEDEEDDSSDVEEGSSKREGKSKK